MPHTRNDWYVGCVESDLNEGGPVATCILDERIAIWRAGGKISAFEDRCVHRAAALSLGRCEGSNLRCMYHGLLFDSSGVVVEIPGQDVIPPNAKVRTYPVISRYGWVWVWMGNPAKADPALLPSLFPGVSFEDFVTESGALDFHADATLISENLLDFSHVPFVHADSFQAPMDFAKSTMKMEQLDRGMRFERWLENGRGHFLYDPQPSYPFDEWIGYDYLIPGVLIMWSGMFPENTARALDFGRPDFATAIGQVTANIQAITPMTEQTTRYRFTVGLHRQLGGDPALVHTLRDVTAKAFAEDKRMIEAQQEVINRNPDRPIMPTVHDRGVTQYNRLKSRLIAEEQNDTNGAAQDLATVNYRRLLVRKKSWRTTCRSSIIA